MDLPLEHVSKPPSETDGPAPTPTPVPAPAVVLLHGRGADERDLLPVGAELPEDLHVLSVRAPDRLVRGWTWYEIDTSAGWESSQPDAADFRRSLDRLAEFVDGAVDTYDLDPDRVGLLGFSQGAIVALSALIERPNAYAWIVALNGYLADEHAADAADAAGRPVFVGCGARDQVIPPERAEAAAERLRDAGLAVRFERYPVGHGTTPEEVADVAAWVAERY